MIGGRRPRALQGRKVGDRRVRVERPHTAFFRYSGEGQLVDVALLDSIMPLMGWVAANLLIGGQPPALLGNDNFTAAPSGTFRTSDGYINIAANKQEQWEALCDELGLEGLKSDPRFARRDVRKGNRKALTPLLEDRLLSRATAEWVERLNARGIPSGAILALGEALDQPQIRHRRSLEEIHTPGIGVVRLFTLTAKLARTPGAVTAPPPALGADTDAVLSTLGIGPGELALLRAEGVV